MASAVTVRPDISSYESYTPRNGNPFTIAAVRRILAASVPLV